MRSAKRLGPKSAGLGMGGFLHRLDLIFTDSKADVNKRVESDSRSAMSCKNDSFDKCPRAAVPLDTVKFAGIEQLNANRHKCGDLPVAPAHGSAALLQQRESQRLWPRPMPRIPAFRRSAPSVRFIFLAISGRGVRAFECALSSRTSSLAHGVRWAEVFFFGTVAPGKARGRRQHQ